MKKLLYLLVLAIPFLSYCKKNTALPIKDNPPIGNTDSIIPIKKATYNGTDIKVDTTIYTKQPITHYLENTSLVEQSGIAASAAQDSIFYIHQDSGNAAIIYIINTNGKSIGKIMLNGIHNRDWEDIAVGPGPITGKSYIYLADIGDNDAKYPAIVVYRFQEPDLLSQKTDQEYLISEFDQIRLKYNDGPKNAESLMVDPVTKDIYIATKESNNAKIYRVGYPQNIQETTTIRSSVQLPFDKLTAGDISSDGSGILLRNKSTVWYWRRTSKQDIITTLLTAPISIPIQMEYQGEGICFAPKLEGIYTNTEVNKSNSASPYFNFYSRKK
ncbi:hypothetical protein I5M32_02420 [Pedobacter sp. SD-b]|uniref:Lipoprotein n=1 Tax=Pedobacter segetis TaxID=2793069 RepID=A0ABS1BG15_9SPHI|nr:hypothetical protein [Pedobacter segetis]MBK0381803.1 hypothetical protein [Pedobacter segetis]